MADISPFKGVVYNDEKVKNLSDVCTPPYDVISRQEQQDFYERHPNNMIRLILGKPHENDDDQSNPHTRASNFFRQWLSENILIQNSQPAIYLTSVRFSGNEEDYITRFGMITLVRLEPFEKGIILPHEKTFSKVKSERLNLMKSCHVNFSPIFSLYQDPDNGILNQLKDFTCNMQPDMDFTDCKGLTHKAWRISDESLIQIVTDKIKGKKLFIADGHHRYETALNYREWMKQNNLAFTNDHPANWTMMYLCSMDEPGLVIFPAHRLLNGLIKQKLDTFIKNTEKYFDKMVFKYDATNKEEMFIKFYSALKNNNGKNAIGVSIRKSSEFYILTAKHGIMERLFSHELEKPLLNLDVNVLTRLVLMDILGFDQKALDDEKIITYTSNAKRAVDEVLQNNSDMAFILNPTKIEQVKEVAEQGLIMPRKSTYFYPKVITGQVMYKLY